MANNKDVRIEEAVRLGLADHDEALRKEATKIQAQLQPNDALIQLDQIVFRQLGEVEAPESISSIKARRSCARICGSTTILKGLAPASATAGISRRGAGTS